MVNVSRPMLHTSLDILGSVMLTFSPGRRESNSELGLDAITDLVCAGIPAFVILRLQMNTRTKVALCILMGLGVL